MPGRSREEEYLFIILQFLKELQPIFHLPPRITEGFGFFTNRVGIIFDRATHSRPHNMSRSHGEGAVNAADIGMYHFETCCLALKLAEQILLLTTAVKPRQSPP